MMEIKVTIEAPELSDAINNLAAATGKAASVSTVCNQIGANNKHIENSGTINMNMGAKEPTQAVADATEEVAPVNASNDTTAATETQQEAPMAPTATSVGVQSPEAVPTQAPTPVQPAPVAVDNGPSYTLEQISRAGAALADHGKIPQIIALLGKYGVQTVNQIKPEHINAVAEELKALGAVL